MLKILQYSRILIFNLKNRENCNVLTITAINGKNKSHYLKDLMMTDLKILELFPGKINLR